MTYTCLSCIAKLIIIVEQSVVMLYYTEGDEIVSAQSFLGAEK